MLRTLRDILEATSSINKFIYMVVLFVSAAALELLTIILIASLINFEVDSKVNPIVDLIMYINTEQSPFFNLIIGSIILVLLSLIVRSWGTYYQLRFVASTEAEVSSIIVDRLLNRKLDTLEGINKNEVSKIILSEIQQVVGQGFMSFVNIISNGLLLLVIGGYVFLQEPYLVGLLLGLFGGIYFFISFFTAQLQKNLGYLRSYSNGNKFKILNDAYQGIIVLRIAGSISRVVRQFRKAAVQYSNAIAKSQMLSLFPRFTLETLLFILIISGLSIKYYSIRYSDFPLELITLISFSAIKLIPAFQAIYYNFSQLKYLENISEKVMSLLKIPLTPQEDKQFLDCPSVISFSHAVVCIKGKKLSYPNFDIKVGENYLISGQSGVGKSMMFKTILGFQGLNKGVIHYDQIASNFFDYNKWYRCVVYIQQDSYFIEGTILENFAFFNGMDKLDSSRVLECLSFVELDKSLNLDVHELLNYQVGDFASFLSGGQRQRLGIARAIYNWPKMLFLDEATNALDEASEKKLLERLCKLKVFSVILISHNPSLQSIFDRVIKLER